MKSLYLKFSLFVIFLLLMGFMGKAPLLAAEAYVEAKKYHPKLESVLGRLAEEYSQDKIAMRKFAGQRSIPLENGEVRVILVPPAGEDTSVINQVTLVSYGVTIEAVSRHLIRARIPISLLEEIADTIEGISFIRLPGQPHSDMVHEESGPNISNFLEKGEYSLQQISSGIISEGVALTGALDYQNLGYRGQGVKVAVIDVGFANLTNSQNHRELPSNVITIDFTGTGLQTGEYHGTGVAEIVYDMAPEAQLYLIKIADEVDLENAKDYCIAQKIGIINHSWVWPNTNFTDGTGLICDIVNDAKSNGIFWANAAGNAVHNHYQGFFTDIDGDNWHEFSIGDEANSIHYYGDLTVYLTWDRWPATDQDYDLYLYDSNFELVDSSTTRQTGTQSPTERVSFSSAAGNYYIRIKKYNANGNQELNIISFFGDGILGYQTAAHSLVAPADSTGVMAVGYIERFNWETGPQGHDSSRGPSNDGRTKPDIMGPGYVSSFTWTIGNYTSAATPHISGAAALVLSRYPDCTLEQLQLALEGWAVDMGVSGKDNIYGNGRLRLLALPLLFWTGEAGYESDGLSPERGNGSTEFIYQMEYQDDNNYAPETGYPKVHISKDGFEITGSPFTMNEIDPADITYTDGKIYTYVKTGLSAGLDYTYYFEAYDSHYKLLAVGEPTSEIIGPTMVLSDNLEDLIVYPNPFSPLNGHTQVTFDKLTIYARIRIFTLIGRLLKEEEVNWQHSWTWDVRNMAGEELARGVYLWIVTTTTGERKTGKIAIIE